MSTGEKSGIRAPRFKLPVYAVPIGKVGACEVGRWVFTPPYPKSRFPPHNTSILTKPGDLLNMAVVMSELDS